MNIKKVIRRTEAYLNSDERKRKEKKKYLKQVIRKLRQHEKALKMELENSQSPEQSRQLKKDILLAYSQRKKGINLLKGLKKKSKK